MVKRRLGIRSRFLLASFGLLPVIGVLAWTAKAGLDELHGHVHTLYYEDVVAAQKAREVAGLMERVDRGILEFLAAGGHEARQTAVDRRITTSVGVAAIPLHGHDTTSLLRAADRALYTAKANGRNRTESALLPATAEATAAA